MYFPQDIGDNILSVEYMELIMATSKFESKSGFPLPVISVVLHVPKADFSSNIRIKTNAQVLMLNINAGTMRVRVLDDAQVTQLSSDGTKEMRIDNDWAGRTDDVSAKAFFDQISFR